MNDLALSVINTGRHYANRCHVAQFHTPARRMEYWRDLARHEAAYQMHAFERPAPTAEEINQAALEIEDYMMRHAKELES